MQNVCKKVSYVDVVPEGSREEHPVKFFTLEISIDEISYPMLIQGHRVINKAKPLGVESETAHCKIIASVDNTS